jgi:carbamoyl-phosphate synthase large subunit
MRVKRMKDITVLLSACNSPTMPGLIKCIKNNGERNIRIIGIDMSEEPSAKYLVDKFYRVPSAEDPSYADIVLSICKNEDVDIYFPNISMEVSALAIRMDEFNEAGVILSISSQESVDIANNKLHTYQIMKENNIPVPKFYPVHNIEDFIQGCKEMGYPEKAVCLKIVSGSGSRGVRIIDSNRSRYQIFKNEKPNSFFTSYEDMLSVLREVDVLDEMMLVEYMPGIEYTVDLLADNGKVLYQVGRENTVSLMSIAQESTLVLNTHAYDVAKSVVNLLKMDGNIGFDFMKNEEGLPVLMDINPRITATVSVIAAGGVNLPYLRIKQLLGEELPELTVNYGVRLKRRYHEMFTDKDGNEVIW